MTIEEYFSTGPAHEWPVFDAVMARLTGVGPAFVEPVSVGIFLKRARTFAELRPMQRWVAISFSLPRRVQHRLIVRKPINYGGAYYHVANVASPDQIDDDLVDWLTEAYHRCPE